MDHDTISVLMTRGYQIVGTVSGPEGLDKVVMEGPQGQILDIYHSRFNRPVD